MAFIDWNDAVYSINVKEFDDHHKKLVTMINDLHEKMIQGRGKEIILPVVEELKKYTIYHFNTEEQCMQKKLYPDFTKHKNEHDKFTANVNEFNKKLVEGDFKVTVQTYSFLKDWLLNHILNSDKKFGTYVVGLQKK